jgi:hypothetical protein
MPGQIATTLHGLIQTDIVTPALTDWPWLGNTLRVL